VAIGQVCPTCKSAQIIRKGTTRTGVQRYQCRNTVCAHPYFRARYYRPLFETHTAYVADWRRRKQSQLKVYHRSLTTEWETPQPFFDQYHAEFGFTLDVCARPWNAKCPRYFTPEDDGLAQPWDGEICFMNPPYGRTIAAWMRKAYESAIEGATVVCLLPVRTDTKWWQCYCHPPAEVRFVPGRLTFGGAANPAPFPNAVVIFRPPAGLRAPDDALAAAAPYEGGPCPQSGCQTPLRLMPRRTMLYCPTCGWWQVVAQGHATTP
jgi:phage N-6-adenine-methyltransferase